MYTRETIHATTATTTLATLLYTSPYGAAPAPCRLPVPLGVHGRGPRGAVALLIVRGVPTRLGGMLSASALPAFARVPSCCSANATACAALLLRASSRLLLEGLLEAALGARVRAAGDRVILIVTVR